MRDRRLETLLAYCNRYKKSRRAMVKISPIIILSIRKYTAPFILREGRYPKQYPGWDVVYLAKNIHIDDKEYTTYMKTTYAIASRLAKVKYDEYYG